MHPVLFKLGPITIYTSGVFVFLGIFVGWFVSKLEAKKDGIPGQTFLIISFWTFFFGIFGQRIVYILMEWRIFLNNPNSLVFTRSGFVFYRGIILAVLTIFILTKKYKINFLKFADIAAYGTPLGHALGRIGCFFYGCCYGKPTTSSIGILFPRESPAGSLGVKVIPTQLISAVFLFLLFFLLLFLKRKKKFNGQILLAYTFFYGIFRFIIEFYRADPRVEVFSLSFSGFFSLILVILSVFLYFLWRRRPS